MFFHKPIDLGALVAKVQEDVTTFVSTEIRTFISNPDKQLPDSVIANIAYFDLPAIETERGDAQIRKLMGDHYDQMLERRLRQLLHLLYIKYGVDEITALRKRVIDTMSIAYSVHAEFVNRLDHDYQYFWLVPLIKTAYNQLVMEQR